VNQEEDKTVSDVLTALKERVKELNCLYRVEEIFSRPETSLVEVLQGTVAAIPEGWRYTDACEAELVVGEVVARTPRFRETPWSMSADIEVQGEAVGRLTVCYREERPESAEGVFLDEERKLLTTIAERIARRVQHENLRRVFESQQRDTTTLEWRVIVDLLRGTDPKLLARVTRKMLYHLAWTGVPAANRIIEDLNLSLRSGITDENRPMVRAEGRDLLDMSEEIFGIAASSMPQREVLNSIQKWIKEDRSGFLVRVLENPASSVAEITNAVERFHHLAPGMELSVARERAFRVSLIRRLLSEHPAYISAAKQYISVDDFFGLLRRVIHPTGSHGKLGGKAAGMLLASHVVRKAPDGTGLLASVKTPRTWYLTSDVILSFIESNDLEEIIEIKYEDIGHVRQEYPYIVNVFKNSPLPPEIINGLSVALDDLGERPLIVRSSSLLEDRLGTSFAGKYKSLFLANQGPKTERLAALVDAITEVFASTFGPDPIEYRAEHNLLDLHEEMGVLIQEVAGTRVGKYFFPAFSGVAFSNNEYRWSRRLRREDGLIRMVPGLGTRAVDRLSDDYPVLLAPGQPSLRPNVTIDEKVRYSPRMMDVINLESNALETVAVRDLLREGAGEYPMLRYLASVAREDRLEEARPYGFDPEKDHIVMTFEGLIARTPVIEQLRSILETLQNELRMAVDIEFAHDGTDLYLLQCRPQSYEPTSQPALIPHGVETDLILFTAHRHVANGAVSGITHLVYVDPQKYADIPDRADLLNVGRVVSRLNVLLPKRQFILMGPGRWGSRGDIRLGVSVTYSDINNSAMLVEIARRKRDYVPEPSFGTHFFQDLVEASIRYLPLYPDEPGVMFNEPFLSTSENILGELVPEFAAYADVVRVIDVRRSAGGKTLQVLMNGEAGEALALFTDAAPEPVGPKIQAFVETAPRHEDTHWQWRLQMVERMAGLLDPERFGIAALYLFGSTKNATAGPESDIDLLVHFRGSEAQRQELSAWLEAWSLSLAHFNYARTGRKSPGLLDIHFISDEDIHNGTSWASKINATTDPARPLKMGLPVEAANGGERA
jgi:pyruvate, water dikinase